MVVRNPERVELGPVPAGPDAQDEPAAADLVDGRGHLREDAWPMEVQARDEGAQADALGGSGERCQERPGIPGTTFGPPVAPIEVVVADPDRVEARFLGGPRHPAVLRPPDLAFDLGQLDADPDRWRHGGSLGGRRIAPFNRGGGGSISRACPGMRLASAAACRCWWWRGWSPSPRGAAPPPARGSAARAPT